MQRRLTPNYLLLIVVVLCNVIFGNALFGNKERVRLQDVSVLTLKDGYMTTGRRSSPVKQLQCIGGTAGCSAFRPQVVQCYNRGSDGYDVQWECKSDMDNAYRFGKIEVICEGYDHPDDEYILRGSCGLEYTIDLTKEGHQKQNHQHNYYGGGNSYGGGHKYKSQSSFGDWITLAIVALIIYAVYKTCIETPVATGQADDGYGGGQGYWGGGGGGGFGGGNPPPPGFRPEYQSGSCGTGAGTQYRHQGGNAGGGGFWTGAATGGLLGYMFGNRGNRGYGYGGYGGYGGYARPRTGFGYASRPSYGGGFGSFGGGSSGGSTGTRTASGFGGTRRR
ncbi:store-operated calcium entry-associated regulatory factor-like [Anneissia japonica]|uniref:store-operated calcium entry-associated regulatory factor-like n=1 Tax=Anneissia japonica TaxID=1529436 RepID=UPI001425B2ED|nr:store-operated calcium entry-associated regulatory factor-like [Anneissia japonica]XP_033103551.1 store-operated calcium entry-associated regulatory factor-like [Anneissia japonica]XP_033103552.1 store-operated calcium entry-associated regulatory factor-like [Anneissia japonica]